MKLMVLDGNSLVNRAFFGIKLLTTKDGRYTNAIYGFQNILLNLLAAHKPDAVAIAWDERAPTAYGRGSRVVGIPHRDSRRGGAQRFFVRRTAALPARVVSSAKVAVPAPGATAPDLRLRCRVLVRPARTGVRPAR